MKIGLFALLLGILTSVAALAQSDALGAGGLARPLKLSLIRLYPITGRPINGVFYALTDSSIIYFPRTKAAIDAVKQGYVPTLDTLTATKLYWFSLKQEGRYLRTIAVATGVSGVLLAASYLQSDLILRVFSQLVAFPLLVLSPIVGLIPEQTVQVRGKPNWLARKRKRLNRYTVEAQRQQVRSEPVW